MKNCIVFSLALLIAFMSLPQSTFADTIPTDKIRQTGIKTTSEIIILNPEDELYYDLSLTKNQKATVKVEILDVIIDEPKHDPSKVFTLAGELLDYNVWDFSGFLLISTREGLTMYDLNLKEDLSSESLLYFRHMRSPPKDGRNQVVSEFSDGKSSTKFILTRKYDSQEKSILKFSTLWSGSTGIMSKPIEPLKAKFKLKVTIEKSGNDFLAAKCKYLKFVPSFLYKIFTGNSNCVLTISNQDVSLNKPESNVNLASQYKDPDCPQAHDEEKKYSISDASIKLGQDLRMPDPASLMKSDPQGYNSHINSFNRFKCKDAINPYIPQKARDIYKLANEWSPEKYPDDYVECVAFVFMTYNVAGNPITKMGTTNGKNFADGKYAGPDGQFTRYQNGATDVLPQKGDIFVWTEGSWGHVGVVSGMQDWNQTIQMTNANTPSVNYIFNYKIRNKIVQIVKQDGKLSRSAPNYWIHKK